MRRHRDSASPQAASVSSVGPAVVQILFESKTLYDSQVPSWTKAYVKELDFSIDDKSCHILTEYLGNNLSKISNELEKIAISLKKNEIITPKIIEENIGISKDFNVYDKKYCL